MSALGHKRTFAVQNRMSALPPKADIDWHQTNVCLVPQADIPDFRRDVRLTLAQSTACGGGALTRSETTLLIKNLGESQTLTPSRARWKLDYPEHRLAFR